MDLKKIVQKMTQDNVSVNKWKDIDGTRYGTCPYCSKWMEIPNNFTSQFCNKDCQQRYGEKFTPKREPSIFNRV